MGTSQVAIQANKSKRNIQGAKKTMGSKVVKTTLIHAWRIATIVSTHLKMVQI